MIDEVGLISFARELPKGDPAVRDMLLAWLHNTEADEKTAESIDYIIVSIEHAVMKYRFGFTSKDEVCQELHDSGVALLSDPGTRANHLNKFFQLRRSIERDEFEIIDRS